MTGSGDARDVTPRRHARPEPAGPEPVDTSVLGISTRSLDRQCVVRVCGRIDVDAAAQLRATVLECLIDQPELVVLDVAEAHIVDDLALTALPALAHQAAAWPGSPVVVAAPSPQLLDALDRIVVSRDVPAYPSVDQALASAERLPGPVLRQSLPAAPVAAQMGRQFVRAACTWLRRAGLIPGAEVIVTELVSNGIRHARTPMELTVSARRQHVYVAVRDYNAQLPSRLVDVSDEKDGGRGLLLVESLATAWGSTPTHDGKVVWAGLRERRAQHDDQQDHRAGRLGGQAPSGGAL
jgi:anti-anti-sigma regulatory factor